MKFSIPASIALFASIASAAALQSPTEAKIYIKSELRSDAYTPKLDECVNTETPNIKVTGIEVYPIGQEGAACVFFKEPECRGDTWTIKVPKGSPEKEQKFSKPFYAGSLRCSDNN